jgi:hypothetical protein
VLGEDAQHPALGAVASVGAPSGDRGG